MKLLQTLPLVFAVALASTSLVAQDKPAAPVPAPAPKPAVTVTPLKVQLVISRFQGEKKISSLPYTLSVNSRIGGRDQATLRMGAKVPVPTMMAPQIDGKPVKDLVTAGPIHYQDVGTNIDCTVSGLEDGRHSLSLTVEDTSIYPDAPATPGVVVGNPSFRSFRASDSMVLRDGGTAQFTVATDKISGEVVRVDVTLTVVK